MRIGEFFLLGFRGLKIPDWLWEFERRNGLGGVILFDYDCQLKAYGNNVQSPAQVRELCADFAKMPSKPLIFVDQEGGKVRRLKETLGFKPLPSQKILNLLPTEEKRKLLHESFTELRALGIHYNLAPVIDLDVNPANPDIGAVERAYSVVPQEVRANVALVNEAAQTAKIGLSLKHYPGLGGATVNSHLELTDISDSLSEPQLKLFYELAPGLSGSSIIVSHGIVQQWDPNLPVSMSPSAIAELRKHVPDTILISDDLQMQGLQQRMNTQEACWQGLRAGLDMICIGNNLLPEDAQILDYADQIMLGLDDDLGLNSHLRTAALRIVAAKAKFNSSF